MTNQQTETKPFRSLADVYREKGQCESCAETKGFHLVPSDCAFAVAAPDLVGAGVCLNCSHMNKYRSAIDGIRKNRSTPAPETGGEKPFDFGPFTPEDWNWLLGEARKQDPEAVVFSFIQQPIENSYLVACLSNGLGKGYTQENLRERRALRCESVSVWGSYRGPGRPEYPEDCPEARARWGAKPVEETADSLWLRQTVARLMRLRLSELTVRKLPLSENLVVEWGTGLQRCQLLVCADTAFSRNAALVEDGLRECGLINSPAGVGSASATDNPAREEPTLAEPSVWGIPLAVEKPARVPCRENPKCRCVYCARAAGSGGLSRAERDSNARFRTDNPTIGQARLSLEAARERLALMDKRERPRPTANSKLLALPHPWECPDD